MTSWIKIHLALRNPFNHDDFKNLWCRTWGPWKNKAFEVQLTKYAYNFFELDLNIIFSGEDHAGPSFELNLFGYTVSVKMYDTRHWDYDIDDWVQYNDNSHSQTSN